MIIRPTIKIELKPFLKCFLQSVYSNDQIISFAQNDQLSALLTMILIKKPKNRNIEEPKGDYIEVYLPIRDHHKGSEYNYMTPSAIRRFQKRIELLFWVTFEEFIYESLRLQLGRTDAIALFIDKYGLPEDEKIKNKLRKAVYRSKRLTNRFPKRTYTKSGSSGIQEIQQELEP